MLKIEAVIRSTRLQQVKHELEQIGVSAFSTFRIEMSGLAHGQTTGGRPGAFKTSALIPKTKIEIICKDKDLDAITNAISKGAKTGQVGDGIVYACPLTRLTKIKNGKLNEQAV
jgi:nitrogen regulatory protein P-II 1